jgi:hypothetical protein
MLNNEELKMRAQSNTIENFEFSYNKNFDDIVVNRMGQNQNFFLEALQNKDFSAAIKKGVTPANDTNTNHQIPSPNLVLMEQF